MAEMEGVSFGKHLSFFKYCKVREILKKVLKRQKTELSHSGL